MIFLRNLVFLTPIFPCRLQRMPASSTVVIFIELLVMHWHFDLVLTAQATIRVYMFHCRQFRSPVKSSFFCSHESFDDVTMDDIRPCFHPPRYPTDGESDSNTRLTPTISVEYDLSESSYSTYSVESDPSEPSYPLVIRLTSNSSASSASPAPPPV